jgi:hypothetical protein
VGRLQTSSVLQDVTLHKHTHAHAQTHVRACKSNSKYLIYNPRTQIKRENPVNGSKLLITPTVAKDHVYGKLTAFTSTSKINDWNNIGVGGGGYFFLGKFRWDGMMCWLRALMWLKFLDTVWYGWLVNYMHFVLIFQLLSPSSQCFIPNETTKIITLLLQNQTYRQQGKHSLYMPQ